ncbi:proline dehydrogenase family protein [Sunxiuqinia dokdonensis]|uniref:proline dehydrogenase n=1 Tax=Sunxiuqinia dokdonensis TaxID=1409788 RepID=A0A0L8V249_9BACT|nr:proline dehydrogenase family protein [Sunxiuqinia dokdonensis]KOH42491.1 proline dehydrogenase [Sunxiuqinia dokdonensis]
MLNKMIADLLPYMPKKLIWQFSKRYIAGEGMEDGLEVSRKLNEQNIEVTIDLLGEFITSLDQAEENKKQYLDIIERFTSENIQGNFSLKPTMFGLLIDEEECYRHLREIVAKAAEKNNFVRIDMEDSQCVDIELELFKKLKKEFSGHVGLVIQAYLRRTLDDLLDFSNFPSNGHPLNFRLCKGIYVEPKQIAYKDYQEVRNHYLEDLELMFKNKMYAGIATHDKFLVEEAMKLIEKHQVPKSMYEFQMLYGVTPELRNSIVAAGHKMRVYVPFGKQWFNYSTRRLKENPEIASHIIKALFLKG